MDKDLTLLINGLAQLNEWEVANLPVLDSITGRMLYYRMAQQMLLSTSGQQGKSLKEIYGDTKLSEKALRLRLREFEDAGLITTRGGLSDARLRVPDATERFGLVLTNHAIEARKIFGDHFYLFHK